MALRKKVLSYTHEQVKQMLIQPKAQSLMGKKNSSPDLSQIPEAATVNEHFLDADAATERQIKNLEVHNELAELAEKRQQTIEQMMLRVEEMKRVMPLYGFKFL